jgi:hypothetical protein
VRELGDTYTSTREMLTWVSLNQNHRRPRACQHDNILHRLYVATLQGLLAYNTADEPFGRNEAGGAKCVIEGIKSDGFLGLGVDKHKGFIYATGITVDGSVEIHKLQVVPKPAIDVVDGIEPTSAPVGSRHLINIYGANITDAFDQKIHVGFAKIRSRNSGEEVVAEDPIPFEGTLVSDRHVSIELPSSLLVGEYLVTIREHSGALVSNGVLFFAYQNPTLLEVEPRVARSKGGALVAVNGRNFVNTESIVMEFVCNAQHFAVNATFVSSTRITARSPALPEACTAAVSLSLL